ncbi:SMP-30/gluconolactonase/LRE family protein [Rhodoferax sp.]|uniref:SMP-30/gluconolactonase/LRE family protein n=1 Tax=Rhodoferax sp. TaxID=50421 RepID=UPI001A036C85|nr:SMP-30/gluconolactonase/LRE family protein [Rhodoferax sp.]MBE0474221.1 SMP-30/gluconolactonase/LRE family protein [Rhodoferax sp.]
MNDLLQAHETDLVPASGLPLTPPRQGRHGAQRLLRAATALALAGLVALMAGCATEVAKDEKRLVWPEPPEIARIEFIRTLKSDKDAGVDSSVGQGMLNFLAGETSSVNNIVDPMGLAVSEDGKRLYVADYTQLAVFGFDFEKKSFLKIGGPSAPLGGPMGVALDGAGNIYVAESFKKGVGVFDPTGKPLNFITDPTMNRPVGLAIDIPRGKLYVVDSGRVDTEEHRIKIFDLQGKLLGKIGNQIGDVEGSFLFPTFISVDAKGNVYVADTLNSRVQMFDPDGKFVQIFGKRGTAPGQFDKPKGVATDTFGNVYVADAAWSNVQIFNPKGQILMFFAGRGTYPGLMQNPTAMTIDRQNRIYVSDGINQRVNVYQLVNTKAEDNQATEPAK